MDHKHPSFRPRVLAIAAVVLALMATLVPAANVAAQGNGLAFTTQPGSSAGPASPLAPSPVVRLEVMGIPVSSVSVTLAIASGTGTPGAVLTCSAGTRVSTSALGYAAFGTCIINQPGTGYRLRATSIFGASATSSTFSVGSGYHLAFTLQPGGGAAGAIWSQQPRVAVLDVANNVVTTDNTTVVTLAIGTNPAGGSLSCTGSLGVKVSAGTAYFTGCSITLGSVNPYTLVATASPAWTPTTSAPFLVMAPAVVPRSVGIAADTAVGATTVGFSISTKVVKVGQNITLRVMTSPALAGARIGILIARKVNGTWTMFSPHASITLDATGAGLYVYSAGSRAWLSFSATFSGNAAFGPARSLARQARWL